MLRLLNDYKISITWATVGHLMLDKCNYDDHDWMRRIPHFDHPWNFTHGDWYDHDPHSDWKLAPEWYASDLVEQIVNSNINQEIGCHTFSHINCSDKNCPSGVLEDEIEAYIKASKRYTIKLDAFVFPGGTFGNFPVLKKHGFKIYRIDSKYKLAFPYRDSLGMLCTVSSYAFGEKGLGYSKEYSINKFKRFIDKAIKTGTVAHFWFHPSMDDFTLNNVLPSVLNYAAKKRDEQKLWIGTMGEIASHINNRNVL
jgi:peptidoglycan/xylan/chitin deacetylase (PgdA/CDA1 family)